MSRWLREHEDDESGVALVTVLLVSLLIAGVVVVMASTATFELRQTSQARDYEAAVHTAEAAVEAAYATMLRDGETLDVDWQGPLPGSDRAAERAEVLRLVSEHGTDLISVEQGPGVGYAIGPVIDADGNIFWYGAGEVDNREARDPYRVIRTRLARVDGGGGGGGGGNPVVFGEFAMLMGGDLTMTDNVTQMTGAVHANGDISVEQSMGRALTDGEPHRPISATGSITCENSWCPWFAPTQWSTEPEVPQTPGSDEVSIPVLEAVDVHRRYAYEIASEHEAWYDLCAPDPPSRPHPSVYRPNVPGAAPCTGERIYEITGSWPTATFHGWQYRNVDGVLTFTKTSGDGGYPPDGVYYVHERNIQTGDLWNSNRRISLIASADPNDVGADFGARSGNIIWRGNSWNLHFDQVDGFELALFADRDIEGDTGTGRADGVVYAREQVRMTGNSQVWGQVIAAGAPKGPVAPGFISSPGSPLDATGGTWGGTVRIDLHPYSFEVDTGDAGEPPEGGSGGQDRVEVVSWQEL